MGSDTKSVIMKFDGDLDSKRISSDPENFLAVHDVDDSISSRRWSNFTINWSGSTMTVFDHTREETILTLENYEDHFSGNPIKSAYITGHGRSGRWVVDHDDTHEKAYGVDVWSQYGWDKGTARSRGYYHRNDPKLQVFEGMDFELALAYNTDQLGRVFEDRTHRIAIRKPKEEVARDLRRRATMHNLNSRGKIGNFVETYPNFEY